MPAPPILDIQSVEKTFAAVRAVRGVSFDVRGGEILALLGPNGAGKTTLVRMIMGITRPDAGAIAFRRADGTPFDPTPGELGYLPEDRGLYKDIPVLRTLVYFGRLRGMGRREATTAAGEWLERLGLGDRQKAKLDTLSKGNQQKVQFISAILHRPALAVLDEPFSGLDPINQNAFLDILSELRNDGMTILLSAHQMALVELLADRLVLMNRGAVVLSGTLAEVRRQAGASRRLALELSAPVSQADLVGLPDGVTVERPAADRLTLLVAEDVPLSPLLSRLGERLAVADLVSERLSLHDIYVRTLSGQSPEVSA